MNLSKLSDEEISAEYWRRMRARRDPSTLGGRAKKLKMCRYCRRKFGVVELREHKPECRRAHQPKAGPEGPAAGGISQVPKRRSQELKPHHGTLESSKPASKKQTKGEA